MLVNEFLEKSAELFPEKVAIICENNNACFRQINGSANSLANFFISKKIKKQDRIVIVLDNSIETVISLFAILKSGAIFVILNPQIKSINLEYILKDCEASAIITDKKHFNLFSESFANCKSLRLVVLTDIAQSNSINLNFQHSKIFDFNNIVETFPNTQPAKLCIDIDLASLIYTSGSTGHSKGVMLTHLNMISAANSVIEYLQNTSDDIILNVLPLAFDYGLYQVLMSIKFGGTVILEKAFVYPYQIINLLIKHKVTGFPLVPTIGAILLTLKNLEKYDFSNLRYITSTSQAFPPVHIARIRKIFDKSKFFSMYGLTECKRVSYLPPEELDKRPSSVGKAIPNSEAYIVDEGGKEIVEPNVPGELLVRGSNVMKGYWNLPNETARVLRPGKYHGEMVLYTGDLFKTDEEGFLYFLGRKDDMFKSSGELISPKEVENTLCEHEDIIQSAVIGIDDEILGKAVKSFVVLNAGSTTTEKEIITFCSKRLESFKVPKFVVICSSLPLTSTGKVQKSQLK